ncbi:MAG: YkgJ family cysteine cluster protein [Bacteroidales bacterium]
MSILNERSLEEIRDLAIKAKSSYAAFFKGISKKQSRRLDEVVHTLHEEVFEEIDCLDCANCCKSISPMITLRDIERLAKRLRMKPAAVVDQYMELDNEGDYVFRETPCPFLMPDNYCMVYTDRPKACREYPHTDRRKFYQLRNLTLKNTEVCPAVFLVLERLQNRF